MCARHSGSIFFSFLFADKFMGSKDTEPYKTNVSFFVSIDIHENKARLKNTLVCCSNCFTPDPIIIFGHF